MDEEEENTFEYEGFGSDENPMSMIDAIDKAFTEVGFEKKLLNDYSFEYPLSDTLRLMPEEYVKESDPDRFSGQTVVISQEDMFKQLARGSLEIPVSSLAYVIPLNLIHQAACDDDKTISFPLREVVRWVGPNAFKTHTPQNFREYNIDEFDDPFTESDSEDTPDVPDSDDDLAIVFDDEPAVAINEEETPIPAPLPDDDIAATSISETPTITKAQDVPVEVVDDKEPVEESIIEPPAIDATSTQDDVITEPPESVEDENVTTDKTDAVPLCFDYPVKDALKLFPPECLIEGAEETAGDAITTIQLSDLFDQIKRGKVKMSMGALLDNLPPELVADKSCIEPITPVALSLSIVVKAIGVDSFKNMISSGIRQYDIDNMIDPFEEPDVLPKFVKHAKAAPVSGKSTTGSSTESDKMPPESAGHSVSNASTVIPYKSSSEIDVALEYQELPGNININSADIEELILLDGVDQKMANEIILYREKNNGFKTVFQLYELDSIDKNQFRRMTGMKADQKKYHRRKRLSGLLKIPSNKVADLNLIAERVAAKSGFSGCVISDSEGLVLAQSEFTTTLGESLSAIIPRMFLQIRKNIALVGAGQVSTVSIGVARQIYTIASAANATLLAVHAQDHISETDLVFLRKVGTELAWLLSLRAYAGPKINV